MLHETTACHPHLGHVCHGLLFSNLVCSDPPKHGMGRGMHVLVGQSTLHLRIAGHDKHDLDEGGTPRLISHSFQISC